MGEAYLLIQRPRYAGILYVTVLFTNMSTVFTFES